MRLIITLYITGLLWTLSAHRIRAERGLQDSVKFSTEQIFNKAKTIRYHSPDSALVLLQQSYEEFLVAADTLQAIEVLLEMADIYGNDANYALSYDAFWKALFLADDMKNEEVKASIYIYLGRLYSFYKRKEEALKYFRNSLEINRRLVAEGLLEKAKLVINYYALCATYRELAEPVTAKAYLDSCFLYFSSLPGQVDTAFLQFERSNILAQDGKNEEALEIMESIHPWFIENRPSYLVLVYAYWGDIYQHVSNFKASEAYYKKALDISKRYNSHVDFTPLVYEKLADLYLQQGKYLPAFESLQQAKNLDARFFDSRSENNRPLLEIKDAFRLEKEQQEKLIQKQRLAKLEQDEKIGFLQRTILLVVIASLVIIGIIYLNYLKSKYRSEKRLIRKKQDMEMRKARELLELKNKELAVSALQLVEKEEFLSFLKSQIKGNQGSIETRELKKILRSISVSNARSWQEFKLRFTAVNERFYQKITDKFPGLTQGDQKICALIKLNFSSKDMAKLLGISVESVHTTRYRLRKKMGLPRSTNLEDFIAAL